MVFQDPMTSLHPMLTVGRQLTEHVRVHLGLSQKDADARALELLDDGAAPRPRARAAPATRTSSPAACASASPSPARWRATPSC